MYEKEFEFLKENKNLILSGNFSKLYGKAALWSNGLEYSVIKIFNKIGIDIISLITIDKSKLDIQDITLLSTEEAKKVPEEIRDYSFWWWLCSSDNGCDDLINTCCGKSFEYVCVDNDLYGVRPALKVNNLNSLNLEIGDAIIINGINWVVALDNYLLCNDFSFSQYRFDSESNDYEKSEIKQYIHEKAREFGLI